jgi:hypothetical protein
VIRSPDPSPTTVASEDLIAVSGLSIDDRQRIWEGVSSAGMGLLLITQLFALARDKMSLLIGQSVPADTSEALEITSNDNPTVGEVVEMMANYLCVDQVMVAVRVRLAGGLSRLPP